MESLVPVKGNYHLRDYDEAYSSFSWEEVKQEFSWHATGKMNMAYETIDRHAYSWRKNKVALYYSDAKRDESYTFEELRRLSNRFGNVCRKLGIEKGERIFIFMPRIPELYVALLGGLKVGAIVGPLFEAFMEGAVYDRLEDSGAKMLVTTQELLPRVPIEKLKQLQHILVLGEGVESPLHDFRQLMKDANEELEITWMDPEDGMILHYTSGSTGKPKGVLHVHYAMLQHYQTAKWILDLHDEDIYWCTADPGWVTGTSYGIFGPWLLGTTSVVRGGRFNPHDWYQTIEKYGVTVWYSAPTAFRMLMGAGKQVADQYKLNSLRHLLSVGEPLNPEVIRWGMEAFQRRIHDTWWMTETGGQIIGNYPCMPIRLGSMGKAFPGVEVEIIDDQGNLLPPNTMGNLVIRQGWPSMMRKVWNNDEKYRSYFTEDGWFISGDAATKDEDGYFWYQGRVDDVIMTAGERVGPFEVESKLVEHPAVAEAGVIGKPDPVRGEIIKAFISLRDGYHASDELLEELRQFVKQGLAAHAAPREIEIKEKLPKTRSGKIMRRVLKAWELKLPTGDLSTLED